MEQLVHLWPPPPQVAVSTVTPLADNKDNHLRFPSWLIFLLLASERPERRCLIFHAELLSAHQGRGLGRGQVDAPPATHPPEGTDSFSQGLRYGGVMSVRLSIWYGVIVVVGGGGGLDESKVRSDEIR